MSDPGAGPSSRRDSPSREENEPKRRKTVGIGRGRAKDQDYLENTIPTGITDVYAPITDKGESGRPVRLMTNFVKWHTPKDQLVQCYRIEFEPPIESVKLKRELITKERDLFSGAYVFDGGNELKTLTKLNSDVTSVLAEHPQGGGISITFRHSSTITWGHPEMFRLYNTQMRRNLQHLGMFQMGRYLFDRTNRRKLAAEFSVELWPGMITAINEHDAGILMALDVIHKVVRTDTVHTMLREMFTSDKSQGRSEWKARARQELPGKIVLAGYSNKTYKIDDIDFGLKASTYTFNYRNEEITLIEYMKRVHNVTILDQHQPLLIVRPTERQRRGGQEDNIYLVPEQCFLTGMTDKMLADYNLKASMATVTQQNPRTRVQTLNDFLQKFHGKERIKNEMEGWGLQVDQNLLMTTGRIMPREKLYSHNDPSGYHYEQETGNFEREMKDKAMREPIRISNWAIVYTRDSNQQMNTFCERIREANRSTGIVLDKPQFFGIDGDRVHNFLQIMESLEDKIQLVVVIVPNNNKERYDAIKKKLCCSDKPKLSQIVTKKIFNKPGALKTIVKKILIQMSVKCGGAAWALEIPPKSLMIVGFDVHHDGARRGQSVGAFVCSLNRDATKWYSRVAFHQTNQEMSTNFASHFIQGLKRYYSINNRLPEKIAVYRDGVSEGQIQHVYETEIKEMEIALETARKDLQESKRIGWAFTIVTKRVRARFFANRPGEGIVNPGPGTIVDRDVTRRQRYDFYLISQSVRKGTVSPTMYNIIGDSTGWKAIHHQQLAYKLCHLYFNWAGTITVPAPCQYARKLAYLTGTALHAEAHPKLSNYLFFL